MTRGSSQTPGRQSKVVVCERPLTDDALSLLAWASAKPAVAQVRFNDYHRNFELVTGDPSTVVRAVYSGDVDGKDGEVVVEGRMKYLIIPALLPFHFPLTKQRTEKFHRRWVKNTTKGQWAFISTQMDGEVYYFEDKGDASLARMFIGDEPWGGRRTCAG